VRERDYRQVLDGLTGLQARLRGEEPPAVPAGRVQALPQRHEPPTSPDAIPRFHVELDGETVSVTHKDLTVSEEAPSRTGTARVPMRPDRTQVGATVIQMPVPDHRASEIAERLQRLEAELSEVLRGLEDAEELLGPTPAPLPLEESTGDPFLDLQRLVARRLGSDPGASGSGW